MMDYRNTGIVTKKQTQSLKSNYQKQLKSLEDLKKSLLEKAFSGELVYEKG